MNAGIFTALFTVLLIVIYFFTINKEGFQQLHIPESPVKQKNLVERSDEEYSSMSVNSFGSAPGAIASFNSLPYSDPSLEKAKYQRILNIQTTLQGFFNNEASDIEDMSDPSIQLPLNVARSDLDRLRNEILVLKRNPGIDSSLTQEDVDEIQANLAYLQKKWRLSIYNDIDEIEGFQSGDASKYTDNSGQDQPSVLTSIYNSITGNTNPPVSTQVTIHSTLSDLNTLITRINVAIANFSSSGTTDPVVVARINSLQQIKSKIQNIIDEVNSGARVEADIPITKDAYNNFLATITNTNNPLPQLLGENSSLADLFPAYSVGDASGAQFTQYLFKNYADILFKGLSWNVSLNYHSEAEQNLANSLIGAIGNMSGGNAQPSNGIVTPSFLQETPIAQTSNAGDFATKINQLQNQYYGSNAQIYVPNSSNSSNSTKPQRFDWHTRANFICDSIQKSGLNPNDFGCLKPDQYVSDDFSWRGYAKMICSRLGTSYDTGLPETCGCPPLTWTGWKP